MLGWLKSVQVRLRQGQETTGTMSETETESTTTITRRDLQLPNNGDSTKLAFVLYGVFTPQECEELIRLTEERGFEPALVNGGTNCPGVYVPDYRKSDRHIWDSLEHSERLWSRIKPFIPETFKDRTVIGINERLRFLRYNAGDFFQAHTDGSYRRDNGDRTLITVQLYLNEGFEGGETTFLAYDNPEHCNRVVPKTGMVLVFEHNIYHEGSLLVSGRKYAVRTDILYTAR